jgi:hypothetical protein
MKRNSIALIKRFIKKLNKNTPKNKDINPLFYQYFDGVDLLAI